jgi:uncharacterized delta-60 repeat protein
VSLRGPLDEPIDPSPDAPGSVVLQRLEGLRVKPVTPQQEVLARLEGLPTLTERIVSWTCIAVRALSAGVVLTGLWLQGAYANQGALDTTFASDGIAETYSPGGVISTVKVAVYPDARTVLGTSRKELASGRNVFLAARVTATGTPDPTFGTTGDGTVLVEFPGYDAFLAGVAVQPDGKIMLAGTVCMPSVSAPRDCNFAAARLLPTGGYDSSFAFSGKIVVPLGGNDIYVLSARALALDPLDGGILIAGSAPDPVSQQPVFALLRLRPSGWPDTSFGQDGKVRVDVLGFSHASSVAVQSSGKIVLAGWALGGPANEDMALARLNRDGSLDTSFGSSGTVTVTFERAPGSQGGSKVWAMALQANDAIIVGGLGYIQTPNPLSYVGPLIRRFTKDGALDISFSGGAIGLLLENTGFVHGIAVQRDNKIVVTGSHYRNNEPYESQYVAYRLHPSGELDNDFGSAGFSAVTGGNSFAVMVQRYGCIVLAGVRDFPHAPPEQWQGVLIRLVGNRKTRPWEAPCYSRIPDVSPDIFPPIILP